jgi:hypothetical protein
MRDNAEYHNTVRAIRYHKEKGQVYQCFTSYESLAWTFDALGGLTKTSDADTKGWEHQLSETVRPSDIKSFVDTFLNYCAMVAVTEKASGTDVEVGLTLSRREGSEIEVDVWTKGFVPVSKAST